MSGPFIPIADVLRHFRTPATITLPGEAEPGPSITGAWLPAPPIEVPPGAELTLVESRYRMGFARADAPGLIRGALITAAGPEGGGVKTWRVDVIESPTDDELRVLMLPVPAA